MASYLRKRWLALLSIAPLVLLLAGWVALRLSLVQTGGERVLPGLGEPVTVRFDPWQRPYVQAATLGDALQAQGWLHAGHRLWQMETLRRAGQGRLAELLGRDLLDTDRELWRAGVPQLAARLEANAGAKTLALVDRYLQGVNAAIAAYTLLPPEFLLLGADRPHWQRRDVFALGALMAFQSANNMQNELLRLALARVLDEERFAVFLTDDSNRDSYPLVLAGEGVLAAIDRAALVDPGSNPVMPRLGFGSNGWVVAAEKSASGSPLYAFDSHDELGLPNLFYEVHLFFGAGRQLRGWSVPGLPGVINGYNEHIAWGFTNIGDTQDLFIETRSPDDPLQFLDGHRWYRAKTETVTIPVEGSDTDQLTVVYTRNGPLISDEPPISLAWTVHRLEDASLDSMLAFNLARNWQEYTAALDAFPAPTLNATYADVHGIIGFRAGGVIPRRGRGSGLVPLDGSDPANRWQGMVPAAEMPERTNPPSGFLAAANARINADGDGPLVSADNAAPYRIARIQAVLAAADTIDAEDMQLLQMDWHDGQAELLLPRLLAELEHDILSETARLLVPLLKTWSESPVASRGSAPALVFQHWYIALARQVFEQSTGELYTRLLKRSYLLNNALDHLILYESDSPWWPGGRGVVISQALNDTARELQQSLGSNPSHWRLEQKLQVELRHELGRAEPLLAPLFNRGDEPWGGGAATVGRARYSYARPFRVNSGATVRVVAEMSAVPRVASVIPGGQSGHPLSRHYSDQYRGWLDGVLYPVAVTPGLVDTEILTLNPAR